MWAPACRSSLLDTRAVYVSREFRGGSDFNTGNGVNDVGARELRLDSPPSRFAPLP